MNGDIRAYVFARLVPLKGKTNYLALRIAYFIIVVYLKDNVMAFGYSISDQMSFPKPAVGKTAFILTSIYPAEHKNGQLKRNTSAIANIRQ